MLNIFLNRNTQRAFTADPISPQDIDSILAAGCSAPSKQRAYPWRVIALTQSDYAVQLKNQLFLDSFINESIHKHLLTAKAPLVLAWIGVPILDNTDLGLKSNNPSIREEHMNTDTSSLDISTRYTIRSRAEKDIMIAASFSMIQAEALGYKTAFTACFIESTAKEILNIADHEWPVIFLSIGVPDNSLARQPVVKEETVIGFSDPRPFPEPAKLSASELAKII
jgi:nitroreductase